MAWTITLIDNGVGRQYQARVTHDAGVKAASDRAAESADRKSYYCEYDTDNTATGTGPDYFWLPIVNRNDPTGRLVDVIACQDRGEKARVRPQPRVRDSASGGPEDGIKTILSELRIYNKNVLKVLKLKGPVPPRPAKVKSSVKVKSVKRRSK